MQQRVHPSFHFLYKLPLWLFCLLAGEAKPREAGTFACFYNIYIYKYIYIYIKTKKDLLASQPLCRFAALPLCRFAALPLFRFAALPLCQPKKTLKSFLGSAPIYYVFIYKY